MQSLGKTLLVANPAAQTGRAGAAARHVQAALRAALGEDAFEVALTQHAGHAMDIAAQVPDDVRTIIALGGDGVVHEVVNGLMRRPRESRPAFAVIPAGSGNDYAATLGMSMKVGTATRQVLSGVRMPADVGCCNGEYFAETLSFGLDAAIARATVALREKAGRSGTALYAQAGIDQLLHHRVPLRYEAELQCADGSQEPLGLQGESFLFAVQIGPTYGGHFRICPKARIDDGMFDICLAHPPMTASGAIALFARAKNGWHTGDSRIEMHTAQSLTVTFDEAPPAQIDGEKLEGATFDISMHSAALTVIAAR
jgi:YegS/Rv2252/BmrU family lipid kinase